MKSLSRQHGRCIRAFRQIGVLIDELEKLPITKKSNKTYGVLLERQKAVLRSGEKVLAEMRRA